MRYATSTSWTLPAGEGSHTIYVKYKDYADNVSDQYSGSISRDTTAPVDGTVTATSDGSDMDLSSGTYDYRVYSFDTAGNVSDGDTAHEIVL